MALAELGKKVKKYRLVVFRLGFIPFIIMLSISESGWEKSFPIVASILHTIGIILVAIGAVGRLWCSIYIGGYKDKNLITLGPYSLTRNPLYLFNLMLSIGIGFITETVLISAVLALLFAIWYPLVIKEEEKYLRSLHGEIFEDYVLRVPRFFPRRLYVEEPLIYPVNPRVWKRHAKDAVLILAFAGIIELIEGLHTQGMLPIILILY